MKRVRTTVVAAICCMAASEWIKVEHSQTALLMGFSALTLCIGLWKAPRLAPVRA